MQEKPAFIVIDGMGGSGKSSVVESVKVRLPEGNFVFTREPGGTELAEEARQILLKENRDPSLTPFQELLLLALARNSDVLDVVLPALEEGKNVIADRFSSSTYAYQGWGRGLPMEYIRMVDDLARHGLEPDFTILLDLDPEVAMARKPGAGDGEEDQFDREGIPFQRRVREGFLHYVKDRPHAIVDAGQPLEVVQKEVLRLILGAVGPVCLSPKWWLHIGPEPTD